MITRLEIIQLGQCTLKPYNLRVPRFIRRDITIINRSIVWPINCVAVAAKHVRYNDLNLDPPWVSFVACVRERFLPQPIDSAQGCNHTHTQRQSTN